MEILDTIPAFNRFVPLIPKRPCRKSLGDVAVQAVLVTGISSKLQSGKSAKGATPFRSLRSPGVTAEAGLYAGIVACVVLALFTGASSNTAHTFMQRWPAIIPH
jgi:hypothetical protein